MRGAWRWLVDDWQWPYAGALAAGFLLVLFPVLWHTAGLALALVFLQLPVYMIHQLEEHAGERFRLYVNALLGSGADVLSRAQIFWINSLAVWLLSLVVLLLATFADLSFGLIAIYGAGFNALVHVLVALVKRGYNPGLGTAVALMIPIAVWAAIEVTRVARPGLGYELLAIALAVGIHAALIAIALRQRPPST